MLKPRSSRSALRISTSVVLSVCLGHLRGKRRGLSEGSPLLVVSRGANFRGEEGVDEGCLS